MEDCESRLLKLQDEFEEFAYIVSHDLKAPVRAIHNLAGWLEEDLQENLPGDSQENFRLLKNRVLRLDKMIAALLDYSRVARYDLEITETDVHAIVKKISENFSSDKHNIRIQGKVKPILTYSGKLTFVLKELLQNAIRFSDKTRPEIEVMLQEENENILITISDNGPGVPETSLPKIFTMFYTAKPKDSSESTGAGLAIVKKIVQFTGGSISAQNQPGGFSVSFSWPKELPTA